MSALIDSPKLKKKSLAEARRWAANNRGNALADAYMAADYAVAASDSRRLQEAIIPTWQGSNQGYVGDTAYIQAAAIRHRELLGNVILDMLRGERGYGPIVSADRPRKAEWR